MRRFLCLLTVLALTVTASNTANPAQADPTLRWILLGKAAKALAGDPVAAKLFDTPSTFLIGAHNAGPAGQWRATRTTVYSSYAAMQHAFDDGSAPTSGAVLYDNERWKFTPDAEKADPARFTMMAAQLVHAHGLLFIATPAMNLAGFIKPGPGKAGEKYLALGIPRDAARYADAIDIQAQSLQSDPDAYARLVREAAAQAREANPKVIVIAGLTTRNRPDGSPPTADDLMHAVDATRGVADGYWLNIPVKSEYCPNCGDFRPDIALDFLHRLAASN